MENLSECDQFRHNPNLYANCRNERLTPEKCSRWRVSRGLLPLPGFEMLAQKAKPNRVSMQSGGIARPQKPSCNKPSGPGTELMALFAAWGFNAGAAPDAEIDAETGKHLATVTLGGCGSCQQVATIMNVNGSQWCEDNIDEIVQKIKENAGKRTLPVFGSVANLPLFDVTARGFVRKAIALAHAKDMAEAEAANVDSA